jgi:hypothetical protein
VASKSTVVKGKHSKKPIIITDNSFAPVNDNGREAPEKRSLTFSNLIQSVVSEKQFKILYGETPAWAIKRREGPGGQMLRYVPHGYTRDQLNKAFGLDWDWELLPIFGGMPFHREDRTEKGKLKSYLAVIGRLTIRIHNPENIKEVLTTIAKTGTGSALWNEGVEFGDALKAADSDALKRAGLALGIALDLYYSEDTAIAKHEAAKAQKAEEQRAEAITLTPEQIEQARQMIAAGKTVKETAKELGLRIDDLLEAGLPF